MFPFLTYNSSGDTLNDIVVKQVGLIRQNLNDHDVFALDDGLKIYQINGPKSDKDERVCYFNCDKNCQDRSYHF